MGEVDRHEYIASFGPTTGDRIRLADTNLFIEVEEDRCGGGDEVVFGGGKSARESMGQSLATRAEGTPDLVITGAVVLDHWGVVKADVGIRDGRIAALGKAGNPDTMDGVHPDLVVGPSTEVAAGNGMILTAGTIDTHVHYVVPDMLEIALAAGTTTVVGGGTGPTEGSKATLATPGSWWLERMLEGFDAWPINVLFLGKGNTVSHEALWEQLRGGAGGFKVHEDWGATPAAIDVALTVADESGVQVAIHSDTLNEAGFVEDLLAAVKGRTFHAYHTEGAGGGHAPDIIRISGEPNVLPASTNPTRPFTRDTVAEALDMVMVAHHLNPQVPNDLAFAESRVRPGTIAAEDVLQDLGALSIMSSDALAMGRIGEVVIRTWQTAHQMKKLRGALPGDGRADNHRARRYVAKYTICPAVAHGLEREIGSVEPGKLADLVLWQPALFGIRPSTVFKGGMAAAAALGDPNASIPTPQPVLPRLGFNSRTPAAAATSVAFVSQAAIDDGIAGRLSTKRRLVAVELGPRYFAVGQMGFMACYFALLLRLPFDHLPRLALAAGIGTGWAYLTHFVLIPEHPVRILRGGLSAFYTRLVLLLDPLVDAVAAGRWDPDISRSVRGDLRQLRRCGAFLEGQLQLADNATPGQQQLELAGLRLRLFDAELAADKLVRAARRVAGAGTEVPRASRAQFAGLLEAGQDQLRRRAHPRALTPDRPGDSPAADAARRESSRSGSVDGLSAAIAELLDTATTASGVADAATGDPDTATAELSTSAAKADTHDRATLAASSRQAIQAALATGLALLVGAAISPSRQYWAAIAAFVVFVGTETAGETVIKGIQRVTGTVAGAVVGFAVAGLTGADTAVVLPLVGVCVFASMYTMSVSQTRMVFWITMMLALLYEFLGKLSAEALELRVLETLVGAAMALAAAAFVLPTRTRERVKADLLALVGTIEDITQAALRPPGGIVDRIALGRLALTLNQRLRRLYESARPLRRAADALRRDGVERRMTTISALAYHSRRLSDLIGTGSAGVNRPSAEAFGRLAEITSSNLHALAGAIDRDRAAATVEIDDALSQFDGSGQGAAAGEQPVVRSVVRINQTILAAIDALGPSEE